MSDTKRKLAFNSEIYAGHTMGPAVGPWAPKTYPGERVMWCRGCKADTRHTVEAEGEDWLCEEPHHQLKLPGFK